MKSPCVYAATVFFIFSTNQGFCKSTVSYDRLPSPPQQTSPSSPSPDPKPSDSPVMPGEFPYARHYSAKERVRESKSCREYLSICERSCQDRGKMLRFSCIGQDFQPFENHYSCRCADESSDLSLSK